MLHTGEVALELRQQLGIGAAFEHFCYKRSAGIEDVSREGRCAFDQAEMRNWSVLRWPVVLAAMSDNTTSARPPIIASSFSGASW